MKLIKRYDRVENDVNRYGKGSIISYGTNTLSTNKYDGWYIKIQLPFLLTKKYINPNSFKEEVGECFPTILFRYRIPKGKLLKSRRYWVFAFVPLKYF